MASIEDAISLNYAKRRRMLSKTHKSAEEDIINSLPDCLLVEILSRVDETKFAIRTGTLSKRWQHLWRQLSNLLIEDIFHCNIPKFYASLERTLLSQTSQLSKLKLHIVYGDQTQTQITNCIRHAISRNVQEIDFDMNNEDSVYAGNSNEFVLPDLFFTSSSFIRVSLCGCLFKPSDAVSWENLRTLHIKETELDEDVIENILSGSPLLETLELDSCYGFERIDITTNKSVKNLGLLLHGGDPEDAFQINAPYILTLAIKGDLMLNDFMLLNVCSVINVELNIFKKRSFPPVDVQETHEEQESNEEMLKVQLLKLEYDQPVDVQETHEELERNEEMLKGHLLKLVHAKEVKLGQLCLEALARLKAKGYIIPSNLKVLGEIASG